MTLSEVRQKYPQYNDLSDEALGRALHSKFYADMPYEQFASKAGISIKQESEPQKNPETTVGGVVHEVAKGALRGPSDVAMTVGRAGTQMLLGPVFGAFAQRGIERLAAPSREIVQPTPATPTERFAGTLAEIGAGGAVGGGFSNVPNAVMTGLSAVGGATGEQIGGQTGKLIGSVAPAAAILPVSLANLLYRGGRNLLDPLLFPGGVERSAARGLGEAVGGRRAAVDAALRSPKQYVEGSPVTAAEAAAPAGSAELAALQKIAASRIDPSGYRDIEKAQQAAKVAALRTLGGKPKDMSWDDFIELANRTRAENAAENYPKGVMIDPRSQTGIMDEAISARDASRANALQTAGRYQTVAAQQENLAHGGGVTRSPQQTPNEPQINVGVLGGRATSPSAYPVEGQPRIPGRYTENIERVPEARSAADDALSIAAQRRAEADYLRGLTEQLKNTVGLDDKGLNALITRPSMQEALKDAASSARERGTYFPQSAGDKFSIENLQRIKESLDAGIKAANNAAQAGRRPELSPGELTATRDRFVKWLSTRSEDWKNARLAYREDSGPINRAEIGQFLENKLVGPMGQERGAAFAQAVRDAPKTITSAVTGRPRFRKLNEVLTPQENDRVIGVLQEELRSGEVERMAAAGMQKAGNIAREVVTDLPPTGMFQPILSAARSWINRLSGQMDEKALAVLSEKLKTPQGALELLSKLPPETRQEFFRQVNNAAKMSSARGAAVTMQEQP